MSLNWCRIDANIATNDKILALLERGNVGHRAFTLYVCAIGWSVGQATDGYIPKHVLRVVHGTKALADVLVEERLWEYAVQGYQIRNFAERQELAVVTAVREKQNQVRGIKGMCSRHHGPNCQCWRDDPRVKGA